MMRIRYIAGFAAVVGVVVVAVGSASTAATFWPSKVTISGVAAKTAYMITGTVVLPRKEQPSDRLVVIATLYYEGKSRSLETGETRRTEEGIHFATERFEILKMFAGAEAGADAVVTLMNKAQPDSEMKNLKVEKGEVR